jgi:hypothetical protein
MKDIRIKFVDFWGGFDPNTFYPFKIMKKTDYNVILDDYNPDFVFGSVFGNQILNWTHKKRIIFSGENIRPDFSKCDYFIGFDLSDDERVFRLPLYQLHWGNSSESEKNYFFEKNLTENRNKFCAFIHSNPNATKRNEFFKKLSEYKKVDSGGSAFNNIGYLVSNKIEWLKDYKFCMCFENYSYDGYLTEKLLEGMLGGCIPIYWGSESCSSEFNSKSFLNWHDFGDDDALIKKIIELDSDYNKYIEMYKQPYLIENRENTYMDEKRIIDFFNKIFEKI